MGAAEEAAAGEVTDSRVHPPGAPTPLGVVPVSKTEPAELQRKSLVLDLDPGPHRTEVSGLKEPVGSGLFRPTDQVAS